MSERPLIKDSLALHSGDRIVCIRHNPYTPEGSHHTLTTSDDTAWYTADGGWLGHHHIQNHFALVSSMTVVELLPDDPRATVCGTCGRAWDDTISTPVTPVPSARCPFEYEHEERDPNNGRMVQATFPVKIIGPHYHHKNKGLIIGYHVSIRFGNRPLIRTMIPVDQLSL